MEYEFIVRLQVSVEFSMVLHRKQMPVGTFTEKAHHYCDSRSWNRMHIVSCEPELLQEGSAQLPLRVFQLQLMWTLHAQSILFPHVGTNCFSAWGCSLPTTVSSLACLPEPQGRCRESLVCCKLRSQMDQQDREAESPTGIFRERKLSTIRVSGLQLYVLSLLSAMVLHQHSI